MGALCWTSPPGSGLGDSLFFFPRRALARGGHGSRVPRGQEVLGKRRGLEEERNELLSGWRLDAPGMACSDGGAAGGWEPWLWSGTSPHRWVCRAGEAFRAGEADAFGARLPLTAQQGSLRAITLPGGTSHSFPHSEGLDRGLGLILPLFLLWFSTLEKPQRQFGALLWAGDLGTRLPPPAEPDSGVHAQSPSAALPQPPEAGSTKELSTGPAARRRSCFLSFCLVVAARRMWAMLFALPVSEFAYWCLLGVESCCEQGAAPS